MTLRILILFLFFISIKSFSQPFLCESGFTEDTMSLPEMNKVLEGSYLEATLKDFTKVRLYKTAQNSYYLRILVKKNIYFNKVGALEIRSGSKSITFKDVKQYKVDKTTGLFIHEVPKNYIYTLTEEGISSLYFANAETDFTRQDASQIRKMAKCFYEDINSKK